MNVMEFSKPGAFALSVNLVASTKAPLESQFPQAKAAILEWCRRRGTTARTLMLVIMAEPALLPACDQFLERVYREEAELAPALQQLEVHVDLLNMRGKKQNSRVLGHSKPIDPASAMPSELDRKPWWKFW